MNPSRRILAFLVVVMTLSVSATALAQSRYQSFELGASFIPDPAVGNGTAGGSVDASQFGSTDNGPCVGMIDTTADHRVTLTSSFSYLKFSAQSSGDTSLVIRGPGGTYYCNDDTDGLNPAVQGAFSAGTYDVFIGDVGGESAEYRLEITEMGEQASQQAQPSNSNEQYQSFNLGASFLPDPAVGHGRAGGVNRNVDASAYGNTSNGPCVGMIDDSPDHTVTLSASFSYLKFKASSSGDTSLVIRGPNGAYYCNDDHTGLDPMVDGAFPAGTYQVNIGSVGGDTPNYTLEITEMQ